MSRTTIAEVQAVMPETVTDTVIETFIEIATEMVTNNLGEQDLTVLTLKNIETFLTAHLIHITLHRQAESKKVGDASEKYASLGKGLDMTTYGSMVKMLDTSGIMANLGKEKMIIEAIASFDDSLVL